MSSGLLNQTFSIYKNNIEKSGIDCSLGRNITSKDKTKIFLKAGTPITPKIQQQIEKLKANNIIDVLDSDDNIKISTPIKSKQLVNSIITNIQNDPVLTQYQLKKTLKTISDFVNSNEIPEKLIEHLTVFSKSNQPAFNNTLSNLVFGTHIGKANNYSEEQLNELMSVLFFENIGLCRLDLSVPNAYKVHPIISKEIVEYAGIKNQLVLESILQHEEKLDGTGYPYHLTCIHEYAQISQLANQHSNLIKQEKSIACLLGKLFMLGQPYDFRKGEVKGAVYGSKVQKALLVVMQEKLKSPEQLIKYATHLHNQLTKIIEWSHSRVSTEDEVVMMQKKIQSTLWVDNDSNNPFKVSTDELHDTELCRDFINDAMHFMYQIVEPADYLNRNLHKPIEINGSPISGDYCLDILRPITAH